MGRVEEGVWVPALSVVGEIGESEIEGEEEDIEGDVPGWRRTGGWQKNLEKGGKGVEAVTGDLVWKFSGESPRMIGELWEEIRGLTFE